MLKLCKYKDIGENLGITVNIHLKKEVAKSETMVLGSGSLSPTELKLLNLIMANVDYTKPNKTYTFNLKELINILDLTKNKDAYNRLKKAFFALQRTIFYITEETNPDKFLSIQLLGVVMGEKGKIKYEISGYLLKEIVNLKSKFLKYDITNIIKLKNKYLIKLYEILKDSFEKHYRYDHTPCVAFEITLKELYSLLNIPESYNYYKIKQRILKKAEQDITTQTDINFSFKEIKSGRKIVKLIFKVSKKIKVEKKDNPLPEPKKKEKVEAPTLSPNALKKFRTEILTNYNNQDKYFLIEDNNFAIKENLLFLNDKPLSAAEALKWWKYIYKNKDQIKEINIKEEKEKAWKEILEELNKIYTGKRTLIGIGGEYADVEIVGITGEDLENLKVTFKRFSNNKLYTAKYTLEGLKGLF